MGRRRIEVHLDLDRRLVDLRLDLDRGDAVDRAEAVMYLGGLGPQQLGVLSEDPDRHVAGGPAQDLPHPLRRIGDQLALESRVAVDHPLNRRERGVVVGIWLDADPDLAGIDRDHLVRRDRPAQVRTDAADPRQATQLGARLSDDPAHLGM